MAFLKDITGSIGNVWQLGLNGARIRSNAGAVEARSADNTTTAPFLASQVRASYVSTVGKRQTVLQGQITSGQPSALSAGAGLNLTINASPTPLTLSFAYGFDQYGCVDYVGQFTSNQSLALAASATCYVFIERNVGTGALSVGYTTAGCVYGSVLPSSPATNLHFYNFREAQMYYYSGSAWIICQRVFVGEAVTAASTITSVITYGYNGAFASNWFAVAANTSYTINHNLGIPVASANAAITLMASVSGADTDANSAQAAVYSGGSLFGFQWAASATPAKTLSLQTRDFVLVNTSATWVTSGFYKLIVSRGF